MAVLIRCEEPDCREKFRWNIEKLGWPAACPICGNNMALPEGDEPATPYIATGTGKNVDHMYRRMEAGSEFRAELADEPSLKMTNMQDNLRAGDVAEMPIVNDVSRLVEAQPQMFGHSTQGLAFSQGVSQGIFPNAGARTQQVIREQHPTKAGSDSVSDRPALELSSPLYQRRV